jgi:hypothetical protein
MNGIKTQNTQRLNNLRITQCGNGERIDGNMVVAGIRRFILYTRDFYTR